MTNTLNKATSGRPAFANDFGSGAAIGKFLKCVAGPTAASPLDVEFGDAAFPLPAVSLQVWVAKYGSDATGDGSQGNPYATLTHALATITDATTLKRYQVNMLPGNYAENWQVKAFVRVVGYDPSNFHEEFYPTHIIGNVTLGASFATPNAIAGVTNIDLDGTLNLNFIAAGSSHAIVSFTNVQLESSTILTENAGDSLEFHSCVFLGLFLQQGGDCKWYNSIGTAGVGGLTVRALPLNLATFEAINGWWSGPVTVDQNNNDDGPVIAVFNNFATNMDPLSASVVTLISTPVTFPILLSDYGDLPENTVLTGAAAALSAQMRIHQIKTIPAGTAIAAIGTTTVAVTITPSLLGATLVQDMIAHAFAIGTEWNQLFTAKCSVTFQFTNPNIVQVNIYNPGGAFNTAAPCLVSVDAYLPTV